MKHLQPVVLLFVHHLVTSTSSLGILSETKEEHGENAEQCKPPLNIAGFCPLRTAEAGAFKPKENEQCYCDALCHRYGDCCVDVAEFSDVRDLGWSCSSFIPVTEQTIDYFYVYQKCPRKWPDKDVRRLCEDNLESSEIQGRDLSFLYFLPVFGNRSGKLYRNKFCAACNYETAIQEVATNVSCERKLENSTSLTFSHVQFIQRDNLWAAVDNESGINCRIYVVNFKYSRTILKKFKPRQCLPSCPVSWPKDEVRRLCEFYTSSVYIPKDNNVQVFKNYHCAVCNNFTAPVTIFRVFGMDDPLSGFPILLDFNFASGNTVGRRCIENEMYCPLLARCVTITCTNGFILVDYECIRKSESTGNQSQNISKVLSCPLAILKGKEFAIMPNFSARVVDTGNVYSPTEYIVHKEDNETIHEIMICKDELYLLINFNPTQQMLSEICLIVSTVCLLIMLAIYSIVPTLRNLPGKILMSMAVSLILGNTLFLLGFYLMKKPSICHISGVIKHYIYLASFFWMNVMAIDIFRTFRGTTAFRRSDSKRTFYRYCMFAWWSPAMLVLAAVLLDTFAPDWPMKPKYGKGICWFNQKQALMFFFAIPAGLLLLANVVLFVLTSISIAKTSKDVRYVSKFSERVRFFLYVKIALILGLTWISGFAAAISEVNYLWYPFIVLSGLQGAFIFAAFTLKMKIFRLLKEQLKLEKKRSRGKSASPNQLGECSKALSSSNLNVTKSTFVSTKSNGSERLTVNPSNKGLGKLKGTSI